MQTNNNDIEGPEIKEYFDNKSLHTVMKKGSILSKYQDVVVGDRSILHLIYFEFCIWMAKVPGALGLFFRKVFWPHLFGSCGRSVFFGNNITLRHPKRIFLGDQVVISDGCILDARSPDIEKTIVIGDNVILSSSVSIVCKGGYTNIGSNSGLGSFAVIESSSNNSVDIGTDVFIGSQCYITGGGNYNTERLNIPIWKQGSRKDGGTKIGNDIWIGAKVAVLGGVQIDSHSIVGAGAVVTKSLDAKSVSAGVPARILRYREGP